MYKNKKIFILGMARSGYECAKLLINETNNILITDDLEQDEDHIKELEALGVKVIIGISRDAQAEMLDDTFDLVIKNPGVPINAPVIVKAESLGIPVTNEIEVAYNHLPEDVKIIGITGSNGKTTTTTLIYEILKNAGLPVHYGGNIGIPLSKMVQDIKSKDILILEISCQQLHDFDDFKTNISVLTNISKTHLDHFLGSYEMYKATKKKIFNNHTNNDLAIINLDNEESILLTNDITSTKKYFSIENKTNCYFDNNSIYYDDELIVDTNDLILKGLHNYQNIMVAIMIAKEFNIDTDTIKNTLINFKGVEHRVEFVRNINNRIFYNDSKSTNNVATITALKSFVSENVILILGGLDRNIPFTELIPYLNNVEEIICYGENKDKIYNDLNSTGMNITIAENLNEATNKAYELSKENDVILLSPASASWDQYKDFEQRGTEFKEIVNNLI